MLMKNKKGLKTVRKGKTLQELVLAKFNTTNPVTRSVYRDIIDKRIYREVCL